MTCPYCFDTGRYSVWADPETFYTLPCECGLPSTGKGPVAVEHIHWSVYTSPYRRGEMPKRTRRQRLSLWWIGVRSYWRGLWNALRGRACDDC